MTYDRTNVIERDVAQADKLDYARFLLSVLGRLANAGCGEWAGWNWQRQEYVLNYCHEASSRYSAATTAERLARELEKRTF